MNGDKAGIVKEVTANRSTAVALVVEASVVLPPDLISAAPAEYEGMACLWSRLAATVVEPTAAAEKWSCVDLSVASEARMVAPERILLPVPSTLEAPGVKAEAS